MKNRALLSALGAAAVAVSGLAAAVPGATASTAVGGPVAQRTVRVCTAHPAPGYDTCLAIAVAGPNGRPLRSAQPLTGFTPTDIQAAYHLTGLKSGGRTVAIVDAYGYSGLEQDLALYRKTYNLPPCTTKNGCLTIMDQNGGTNYPDDNANWDLEQALDVDAVSATCPDCKIVMVQAYSASTFNLGTAEDRAAMQKGVVAISNSYIGADRKKYAPYNHRGIAITAGTGDGGYKGGQYPAEDNHVIAVSGTAVTKSGDKYTETAWSGTGSGCAGVIKQPTWQSKAMTSCTTRAVGDVSAAASPSLGGLEICYHGQFEQVGGTSEATPIIASVYALSGDTRGYPAKLPYLRSKYLNDITSGTNGSCGPPLCTAGKGWDGVTGVGSPNGVKGF